MQSYELVVLVPVGEKGGGLMDQVKKVITNLEGKIDEVVDWGEKPLAHPIKKQNSASFYLLRLVLPPQSISNLDKSLRINENVLRHLLIRAGRQKAIKEKSPPSLKLRRTKEVSK